MIIEVHQQKEKEELKAGVTSAFYSAYFSRLEKLSSADLERVLKHIDKAGQQAMTDAEMFEVVKQLNSMLGGTQKGGD